jgi:hypothetical protein
MERVKWADQRKIAAFVRGLYGLDSVQAISQRVVQGIDALIGGDSSWVFYESKANPPHLVAENVGPEWQKLLPAALALRHEHPGIRHHHAHRGQAVAIADLLPLYQWKRTELYSEVFSKLDMQEQLGASFPFAFPDMAGVIPIAPAAPLPKETG